MAQINSIRGYYSRKYGRSITEFFSTGSSSSCLPRTGVSSPNAADAVVDDDEASRWCSDRLSPLPETETSGSCLGSSGDDQLEDDEMALDDNEMALEQPESESAGSVPGNAAHPPSRVRGFLDVGDLVKGPKSLKSAIAHGLKMFLHRIST